MKLNPVNNQNFGAIHLFKYRNSQIRNKAHDIIKEKCDKDWAIDVSDDELLVLDGQDSKDLNKAIMKYRPEGIINGSDYDRALLNAYKQKAVKVDLSSAEEYRRFSY